MNSGGKHGPIAALMSFQAGKSHRGSPGILEDSGILTPHQMLPSHWWQLRHYAHFRLKERSLNGERWASPEVVF